MVYGIAVRKLAKHFQTPREAREYLGLPEEVRDKDWSLRLSYVNGKAAAHEGVWWLRCSDLRIVTVCQPERIAEVRGKTRITRVIGSVPGQYFQIEFGGNDDQNASKSEKSVF
ncbi:hypothetical protein KC902_02565 [Candidatus Kaiserbacteria bacterium]|nr:hypothetical protein [Candidatus Kaiserbacteria bacterium]USN88765.1 MAG: hypothetical protein H6780_04735 [Candidatus Nomurabacteria bacterium]